MASSPPTSTKQGDLGISKLSLAESFRDAPVPTSARAISHAVLRLRALQTGDRFRGRPVLMNRDTGRQRYPRMTGPVVDRDLRRRKRGIGETTDTHTAGSRGEICIDQDRRATFGTEMLVQLPTRFTGPYKCFVLAGDHPHAFFGEMRNSAENAARASLAVDAATDANYGRFAIDSDLE